MKIGVISDTHGNIAALDKALNVLGQIDLLVHAGDVLYHPPRLGWTEGYDVPSFVERLNSLKIPVVIAQGNCDPQVYEELLKMPVQSPYAVVEFEGTRVIANHGHLMSRDQMVEMARRHRADYFVSGHTHVPVLDDVGGAVLMNPGSPSLPKYKVERELAPTVGVIADNGASIMGVEDGSVLFELLR